MLPYIEKIRGTVESQDMKNLINQIPLSKYSGIDQLRSQLTPHQKYAIGKLYLAKRLILGDEMRLGKSVVLLGLCKILQSKNPNAKFLFIMPDYLKHNFKYEINKWFPEERVLIIKTDKDIQKIKDNDFIIINYDKFRLPNFELNFDDYDVVALDESHRFKIRSLNDKVVKGKNHTAKQMLNLYNKLLQYNGNLYFATGSPMTKSFGDLYGPLRLLIGDEKWGYKSYTHFCTTFCHKHEVYLKGSPHPLTFWRGYKESETENIKTLLQPNMLRRTLKEIYPDKIDAIHQTIMSQVNTSKLKSLEVSSQYQQILTYLTNSRFAGDIGAALSEVNMTSLYRSHLIIKQKEIYNIIDDLRGNAEKILVVNPYIQSIERLHDNFTHETSAGVISSKITSDQRTKIIDAFRVSEDNDVLFATASSISEGFDLSFCDTIIITQPILDITVLQQVIKRLENIKRTTPYKIVYHVYENTFEKILHNAALKKIKIANEVINSGQQYEEINSIILNELKMLI